MPKKCYQLEAFNSLPCASQSLLKAFSTSSEEPFFTCLVQHKSTSSNHARRRLYSDVPVTTQAQYKKPTYLRGTLDTAAEVNQIPTSVYKQLFCDYSLQKFETVQANLKVYNSI